MQLHLAHTVPINPPSATPKLTRAQVWAGLKTKSRDPVKFISAITECEVVETHATGLTRLVSFKPGTGPPGKIKETVEFTDEVRADFYMEDVDTRIANIISTGDGESDLYLTFTFAWNLPDIEDGTAEAKAKKEQLQKMAEDGVKMSLKQIREVVVKGQA